MRYALLCVLLSFSLACSSSSIGSSFSSGTYSLSKGVVTEDNGVISIPFRITNISSSDSEIFFSRLTLTTITRDGHIQFFSPQMSVVYSDEIGSDSPLVSQTDIRTTFLGIETQDVYTQFFETVRIDQSQWADVVLQVSTNEANGGDRVSLELSISLNQDFASASENDISTELEVADTDIVF